MAKRPTKKQAIKESLFRALTSSKQAGNYPGGREGSKNPNFVEVQTSPSSKAFLDNTVGRKVKTKNPSKTKAMRTY